MLMETAHRGTRCAEVTLNEILLEGEYFGARHTDLSSAYLGLTNGAQRFGGPAPSFKHHLNALVVFQC